jgi:autotransporter-associated beta strand protein
MIAAAMTRALACALLLAIGAGVTRAQETWNNPATVPGPVLGTFDFNANLNWTPATVPTGTAFFGVSTTPDISFSANTTIGGWTFNAGASDYTFTISPFPRALTFNGAGIVINGGSATISNDGFLTFGGLSTAGDATITNNAGGFLTFGGASTAGNATITNNGVGPAGMGFFDSSTAGNSTIVNNGTLGFNNTSTAGNANITNQQNLDFNDSSKAGNAAITNNGSLNFRNTSTASNATITNNNFMDFFDTSTAGNATITNNNNNVVRFLNTSTAGNATIANTGGFSPIRFVDTSTAGNATITNNSFLEFLNTSTAGNATITTNSSARTSFFNNSTGGNARLIANAGGTVDFSLTTGPAGNHTVSAGSIEGAGTYFLGSNQLTVGSNNLSTTVSGTIQDGGFLGGIGASLVKVGTGTLTLTGTNTYTGGTTVAGGLINFNAASKFGSGTILLNGGGLQWAAGTSTDISSRLGAFGNAGAIFDTNGNDVTLASVLSGLGGMTKIGAGALTLTGTNTYSGATTVNAGTLFVNGSRLPAHRSVLEPDARSLR